MNTFSTCMQCQVETGVPNFGSAIMTRIPDDGVIDLTCDRGHRTVTIIQEGKFEILSQMAIRAIVDGYYRDAVASFAGALERLYEFFVRVACRNRNIDVATFDRAWKELSNQSERQLGTFVLSYLIETGTPPQLLHQNQIKFRNSVIHKGTFPTQENTVIFGQAVLDCALPVLEHLKSAPYSAALRALVGESIRDRSESARQAELTTSTMSIGTLMSLTASVTQTDVRAAVDAFAATPDFLRS